MKRYFVLFIIIVSFCFRLNGQVEDLVVTGSQSGTVTNQAMYSVTLGPNYTYTPNGGTLTVQIANPYISGSVSYSSSQVDPESRTLDIAKSIGATNGSFAVNAVGGAEYSIPFKMLPGVNGLTPSFSLVYSSNNGPGIAGYGWGIGGISMISRGPQTYYSDAAARGVELDASDRFYFDGQRLVPTSGNYGVAGTTYQTDNDIFTRITPQAYDANGPGWFKTETKSGLVSEYGNNSISKQRFDGLPQILSWYVSKVSDLYGNQINYLYIKDNNAVYPAQVTYGPNVVTFYYKSASDTLTSFLKGSKILQRLLLDKVTINYNGNIIRTYQLKYVSQGDNCNSYSTLNEIIENGEGISSYNSTAISYQVPANVSFSQTVSNTSHLFINYNSKIIPGDYNGDGKTDLLCLPTDGSWTGMKVYFSDGNNNYNLGITSSTQIPYSTLRDIRSLDLNGDGIDDILYEYGSSSSSTFSYILCNGSTLTSPVIICSPTTNSSIVGLSGKRNRNEFKQEDDNERNFLLKINKSKAADYNGDGIEDVFINSTTGYWEIYSFGNGLGQRLSTMQRLAYGTISTINNETLSGDFNGDGKDEIWSFDNSGVSIYAFNGSSLTLVNNSTAPSRKNFFNLGDFNGDGKCDVFIYGDGRDATESDMPIWQILLSNGSGFETHYVAQKKINLKDDYIRMGDFNGDGAIDVMVTSADMSWGGTKFYISKNRGTDFYIESLSTFPVTSQNFFLADYKGEGHTGILSTDGAYPWTTGYQVYGTSGNTSILMAKVGNGLGSVIKPTFTKLSQASSATFLKGTGAVFPVTDYQGPVNVVSSTQVDNGKGSYNTQNYYYEAAKIHFQGKGFLGYLKSRVSDLVSGIDNETATTGFNSTYFYPLVTRTLSKLTGTTDTIQVVKNTWDCNIMDATYKRVSPYIKKSQQTDNHTGFYSINSFVYDSYGNPTLIIKSFSNGPTQTITTTYNNSTTTVWLIGRPIQSSIKYSSTGNTDIIRTVSRSYSASNNTLNSETWYSTSTVQFVKGYKYNSNGTLKRDSVTISSGSYRTTTYSYESNGIRLIKVTDPLLHVTTYTYNTNGNALSKIDFLSDTTYYSYDELGNETGETHVNGMIEGKSFIWGDKINSSKPARYYFVQETSSDGRSVIKKYDNLKRAIRTESLGFDGSPIFIDTRYDIKGMVDSISELYLSGIPIWNRYIYDSYGRKTNLYLASGRNSVWTYINGTINETTAGKSYSKTLNSDGTISSSNDPGGMITYTYYPDGKIKNISAPGSNNSSMEYDIAGNQTKLTDPSAGIIQYTYNGFGDLVTQTNAKNQVTNLHYNSNGTLHDKVTAEGTYKYRYTSNNMIRNVASPNGTSRSFVYGLWGKVASVTDSISGSVFLTGYAYDKYCRLSTITHPSGIIEIKKYNLYGYLDSVSAGGSVRWIISSMDERRNITSGQFGSNLPITYLYDGFGNPIKIITGTIRTNTYHIDAVTGNLLSRTNNKAGLTETFNYDNLDRLDNIYKGSTMTLDMAYNSEEGGIITKSDVGTLNYDFSAKPYELSSVVSSTGVIPAVLDSLTYTSFGSVSTISEGISYATFNYNAFDERSKMEIKQSGSTILTRWYSTDSYIKETSGSVTKEYTFIGGSVYSAPAVAITQSGTTTYYYLLRDHLGSITHVVNASTNTVAYEYSYDAWGRLRNPSTWAYYAAGSEPALFIAGRGYTGHEHLPWFSLINMNGRLYDATVGQFLNPDNYNQDAGSTLNFNRFAYCLNNPLKYADPSGMLAKARDESDAAFDAYFYWLCDESMSAGNMVGGGGGGGYTGGHHFGTMGSGYYDVGFYTIDDLLGSLWSATPSNQYFTFSNVDGDWYHTSTSFIYNHLNFGSYTQCAGAVTAVWGPGGNSLGETVSNFLGIKGLTANDFYWYSKTDGYGSGGLKIDLSYTSNDAKTGYSWIQMYSDNGGPWTFDNRTSDGQYSGSIAYYSPQELAKKINGNTISFYDAPRSPANNDSCRFVLSLYNGNDRVFSICYGYNNVNGVTSPYYPKAYFP